MKKSLLFFLSLLFVFSSLECIGQCAEKLSQAQDQFDSGHLYGIPALLTECINKGSKQDKIEAYRLLTLTYLYIDDPIAAQNSFISLLKLDPEYRVDSTNHIELVHLSKEFITTPIVSWSSGAGVTMSNVSVINENGPDNINQSNERYEWGVGSSLFGTFELHFSKIISFRIESDLSYSRFKYFNKIYDDSNGEQNKKDEINITEKSWNYSLPVSIKLTYPGEKFYPYIYGGYSPTYNITTTASASTTNNQGSAKFVIEDGNLNLSPIRVDFAHSYIIGLGLMRRINYNYVFLDVRYKIGIRNRLDRDAQYEFAKARDGDFNLNDFEDINRYTLIHQMEDNDFRQNELTISAGFIWPKYKPRKRKSITAMSFLGNLFKKKGKDE